MTNGEKLQSIFPNMEWEVKDNTVLTDVDNGSWFSWDWWNAEYKEPTTENDKLTNSDWIDFLSEQFDISRTSAKEMLHTMMSVKKEDNFKKQFSGRK